MTPPHRSPYIPDSRTDLFVTKDDLLKAVWPDTFVEETNLSRNVFLLRKALGESPQDHQYIVTVPGRGYRFAEEVQLVPAEELTIVAASHSTVHVQLKETRPWGWITVGAVALSVVAVISFRQFARRPPVLTEKDTIVLADFTNSTGNPVFDDTLRQGLAIQLEQSRFLKIMDDDQMQRVLRRMSLSPVARVTNQSRTKSVCAKAPRPLSTARSRAWEKLRHHAKGNSLSGWCNARTGADPGRG